MMAPAVNVAFSVLNELIIAQRKGTTTQIAARIAIKQTTTFPPRLEWVHIRLSIILPRELVDAFSHLLEEDRNENRDHNQIKDAHRRATTKVEKLDGNQIVHDAEELGTRAWAATR